MKKIYLAGPFFSQEQLDRIVKLEQTIVENNFLVFSPRLESFVPPNATRLDRKNAFESNIVSIDEADFLVAVYDGKDVGTMFECGYAYSRNIPILYFAETLGEKPFNLMLSESSRVNCSKTVEELDSKLKEINNVGLRSFLETQEGYDGLIE